MRFATVSSPHLHSGASVSRVMGRVLIALVPGAAALIGYFGWGVAINLTLAIGVALLTEAVMLRVRGRPVKPFLGDLSIVLTAVLLVLAMPPLAPWWLVTLGVVAAVILGKHLYGGIGYNPFNPAMLGFVVLLICFPLQMSMWTAPAGLAEHSLGFLDTLRYLFTGTLPEGTALDAITAATPLDHMRTQLHLNRTVSETLASPIYGLVGGHGFQIVFLLYLVGGIYLLITRTIAWQIPAGMLGALVIMALVFQIYDPDRYTSPLFHLFSGATLLGAFFIATDPVTASTTPLGRLLFGAGIGILTYVIRTWGGYPDGVAFAVLFMNMLAPLLDQHTQSRVYGQSRD